MKKLAIAFIVALLALAFVAGPALAYTPPDPNDASADVECEDPGVDNENPQVGDTVLFYGTINYDISAYNNENYSDGWCGCGCWYQTGAYVLLSASGEYSVLDPEGNPVAGNGFDWSTGYIMGDTGFIFDENVSAAIDDYWYWEAPVLLEMAGDYVVQHSGDASAEYGHWVQYGHFEGYGIHKHFVPDGDPVFYPDGDPAYDACMAQTTVTSRGNAGVMMLSKVHPTLTIQLPAPLWILRDQHDARFHTVDGWGNPTTEDIVYSDGIWQVEVLAGTVILMDGEWQKLTTIEIDDQGNVIGRYGKDGHKIAKTIELSQPIAITKVG